MKNICLKTLLHAGLLLQLHGTPLLCNFLKQFEFLSIDRRLNDRNEDAFHEALKTWAAIHRRGNLDVRFLVLFYRGHAKGGHGIAS